jgi:hypothetical protein
MPMLRFVKNLLLCSKSLRFSHFIQNLAVLTLTRKALRFAQNRCILLLCLKSLRFSRFVQKPCSSHAFSKSFAHCSKSLHSLALPKIFALFALCPKALHFSQNRCASLKIFALP